MPVDLNADVGEGMDDRALLPFLTSANVACGLHAGDPTVMDTTVAEALERGVCVGAHPGYADRENFGRIRMRISTADVARAIARGVRRARPDLVVVGQPGSRMLEAAREAGLPVAAEAFADRRYRADGTLVPRSEKGALLTDPDEAAEQAMHLARDRFVLAEDGSRVEVDADTICLHGDTPGAPGIARRIRERFRREGVAVAPPETYSSRQTKGAG